MSTNEMSAKVRELKELQQLIEEATAEAEAIKDAIKAEMEARSVEEMTVDVFKVRWKKVTSSRIDTTALKKGPAGTGPAVHKENRKPPVQHRIKPCISGPVMVS